MPHCLHFSLCLVVHTFSLGVLGLGGFGVLVLTICLIVCIFLCVLFFSVLASFLFHVFVLCVFVLFAFYPVIYRRLFLCAPEPKFRFSSPFQVVAVHRGHKHIITQQVAMCSSVDLCGQVVPVNRWVAMECSSFLHIRIVCQVERFTSIALHIRAIRLVEHLRVSERTRGQRYCFPPGSIKLTSGHCGHHLACFIFP